MDCRETQTLLTAFHDGELPAADRARVEVHLRGCPECAALLADLARVDQAAGVPDPGPAYWNRFNARVMDRVEREAGGPKVAVLRPKHGWMRQQLRYLVPAAAAAALVVGIVRYGGMHPGALTPIAPPAESEPAAPVPAEQRMAKTEPGSGAAKKTERTAVAPRVPPPAPLMTFRSGADGQGRPGSEAGGDATDSKTLADGIPPGIQAEQKKMAGAAALRAEQEVADKAKSTSGMRFAKEPSPRSPCELARTLAEQERFPEAETAQRACLAGDLPAPSREKGLVFLAELLDRQSRFAEADAVITEVDRKFPQSRPLDLYRQQRPMMQKRPE